MQTLPRLRLEPRPSMAGFALTTIGCLAAAVLAAALPLPLPAMLACLVAIGLALYRAHRRLIGRGVPAIVHVGVDRSLTITDWQGRSRDGIVLPDSYVGARLTTIVWRAHGAPWWRLSDVILVLPDTLPPDDFRRLRIFLRYSRVPVVGSTSGVDTG